MYINRDIESAIRFLEGDYPVLTIIGPRQSGKTSLVRHLYPDHTYVNLEHAHAYQLAIDSADEFFRVYPPPVVIDEIQRVPELLRTIQVLTDESGQQAKQFIITGSQEIHSKGHISQSLAGRTALFHVLPLSIGEMKASGAFPANRDAILLKGCYPKLYAEDLASPYHYYQNYISTYIQKDVKQITAIKDERLFYLFLKLLAGRVGNLLNVSSVSNDLGISRETVNRWLSIIEASHIIQLLNPWSPGRTGSLVKTPKVYFCDTGVVSTLLDISTEQQMLRDPLRGAIFENFCVMEAMKQRNNKALPQNLYFYRTKHGVEVDLLFEENRCLTPYEIKSSDRYHADQFSNLRKFSQEISKHRSVSSRGGLIYAGQIRTSLGEYEVIPFTDMKDLF